jgi:CRP/FNR family transcriptional regulator
MLQSKEKSGVLMFEGLKKPTVYEKEQFIYRQEEKADFIYYLKKGKVKSYIISPNGTEKTIAVFAEGDIFGKSSFFDKQPHFTCAKALTKSEIIVIDKKMMLELIGKNPQFALDMLEDLSKTIRMLSNQIENMSFHQTDKRIAMYLIDNTDKSSQIVCTHDEISAVVGASRITVSKILSRFTRNGWIETRYRKIKIINPNGLTMFAVDNN